MQLYTKYLDQSTSAWLYLVCVEVQICEGWKGLLWSKNVKFWDKIFFLVLRQYDTMQKYTPCRMFPAPDTIGYKNEI